MSFPMTLLLLLLAFPSADSIQVYYAEKDVHALEQLYAQTSERELLLLCRYRLYPLTQDEQYVAALPQDLDTASASELALLSGLWGYRAAQASIPRAIQFGYYADRLLKRAQQLDPADPFVLLVAGQSLLFRPAFAGGSKEGALNYFQRLRHVLNEGPKNGISPLEADLWIWYTLRAMDDPRAPALRERLLAHPLPPLYREFLGGGESPKSGVRSPESGTRSSVVGGPSSGKPTGDRARNRHELGFARGEQAVGVEHKDPPFTISYLPFTGEPKASP